MSGGPQVFLGATTFCLDAARSPDAAWLVGPGYLVCPWAAARPLAVRAASFARRLDSKPGQALPPPAGTAARPRRPRGGLQSGGAGNDPAGPRPLPRAPQSGPAVRPRRPRDDRLLNNVARNSRASISNTEIASLELQRFEHILKTDRCKLRATFARGYVVPRRTDDETPLADAVRSLWPTQVRPPSASTAPRQRTRRSTPRRRWGGSSRAGGPGAGSTGASR